MANKRLVFWLALSAFTSYLFFWNRNKTRKIRKIKVSDMDFAKVNQKPFFAKDYDRIHSGEVF